MSAIFDEIEIMCKATGISLLSVNTYPSKFENMPKFLEKKGFEVIRVISQRDISGVLIDKLCYQKSLC